MRKILATILLLFSHTIYSQEYVFDKFIEYEELGRASVVFMFNSKESTYFFFAKNFGSDLVGSVIDEGKKMIHRYKMENFKNEIVFTYLYSETEVLANHKCYKDDNSYETKQISSDSLPSFEIKRFNKNRKNVVLVTTSTKVSPDRLDSFSTIMENLFHHFICCHKLELPSNYIPSVAKIKYSNGNELETKLVQTQNINTQLSIKQGQLKLKKDDEKIYKHRK